MSQRFFTADWHLDDMEVISLNRRPFSSIEEMNNTLISNCNKVAGEDDQIIHLGDFCIYGKKNGIDNSKTNPVNYIKQINGTFINVKGNHDDNNKVKSLCDSLRTSLGKKFLSVSCSHYPSYDLRSNVIAGDVHLCGHVHRKFKYMIDSVNQVLNINVGVDVWGYTPVSEDKLIEYIIKVMKSYS
jgi:calcineurin-like phosphoesterase family protein